MFFINNIFFSSFFLWRNLLDFINIASLIFYLIKQNQNQKNKQTKYSKYQKKILDFIIILKNNLKLYLEYDTFYTANK